MSLFTFFVGETRPFPPFLFLHFRTVRKAALTFPLPESSSPLTGCVWWFTFYHSLLWRTCTIAIAFQCHSWHLMDRNVNISSRVAVTSIINSETIVILMINWMPGRASIKSRELFVAAFLAKVSRSEMSKSQIKSSQSKSQVKQFLDISNQPRPSSDCKNHGGGSAKISYRLKDWFWSCSQIIVRPLLLPFTHLRRQQRWKRCRCQRCWHGRQPGGGRLNLPHHRHDQHQYHCDHRHHYQVKAVQHMLHHVMHDIMVTGTETAYRLVLQGFQFKTSAYSELNHCSVWFVLFRLYFDLGFTSQSWFTGQEREPLIALPGDKYFPRNKQRNPPRDQNLKSNAKTAIISQFSSADPPHQGGSIWASIRVLTMVDDRPVVETKAFPTPCHSSVLNLF